MCTVSYIQTKKGIILTSSRDEQKNRTEVLEPRSYTANNITMVYPKDISGNGTWIGHNNKHAAAVLLNGAFVKHEKKARYRHSRALIIPEILSQSNPATAMEQMNLVEIEPFTLILLDQSGLTEFRWDEQQLHKTKMNPLQNHFWCSCTLYSRALLAKNKTLFENSVSPDTSAEDIFQFHYNLLYEQQLPAESEQNYIRTISITQLLICKEELELKYTPLLNR